MTTFATSLQSWTEIDLPSLQKRLDEQGISLKEEQKALVESRKNLAARTKEFRKLPEESKPEEIKPLLKLYQKEIDTLTNSKKTVEGYFFGLYRVLAEAPDPKPLLEMSLDAVALSQEATKDKEEITRLKDELAKRADYEQLKQRLLQLEQKSASVLSARLASQEDEFRSMLDEKESNWSDKEKQLTAQIRQAQKQIEELRSLNEVKELKENSNRGTTSDASVLAELDIVSREAEASKRRVLQLEQRNESLRKEMSKLQSESQVSMLKQEWEGRVSDLERENALLVASLDQTRKRLDDVAREKDGVSEQLARESASLTSEIKNLRVRLEQTHDYEEIKNELALMRQIEFGEEEETEQKLDVDSVLLNKNKTLTEQLADYRAQHEELQNRIQSSEQAAKDAQEEVLRLQALAAKLEADLVHQNDTASMISGVSRPSEGILPIVTKQRDRFRARNKELEDELKRQNAVSQELRRQMNAIKADNEQLYERTRYLASFNSSRNDPETPYAREYDAKLHPIEQFRIREQERISSRLGPVERLFVSITRAILATRLTRSLFLGYIAGLHGVVMFVSLYVMGLHTRMTPEVGLADSTGGRTVNQ